ncbi:MAG: hypothetical protein ABL967_20355 [Bryobacteraceae bacterium]
MPFFSAFASLLITSAVAAEPEQLVMPQFPAAWTKVFSRGGNEEMTEYAPAGQSKENFQDKITVEVYRKLNLPLDALQRRTLAQTRAACDGTVEGKFQSGVNNGYASAFWTLGCKRLKRTNFGETRYTKTIQAGDVLYVITRVWRTKNYDDKGPDIAPQSIQTGTQFLITTVVCQTGSTQHPCPVPAR